VRTLSAILELTHLEDQFLILTSHTDNIDNAALRRLMGGLAWFTRKKPSNVLPLVNIRTHPATWFGDVYKKVCANYLGGLPHDSKANAQNGISGTALDRKVHGLDGCIVVEV
jgi:hypothetical protein